MKFSYLLLRLSEVHLRKLQNQYVVSLVSDGDVISKRVLAVALRLVQDLVLRTGAQDRKTHPVIRGCRRKIEI